MARCLIDAEEIWAHVVGYDGAYNVSSHGRVVSVDRRELMTGRHPEPYYRYRKGKELSTIINKLGYEQVNLSKNGKQKLHLVHRLVAKAFLLNPTNLPEVNHKNEVKSDNWVDNLEWCTRSHNAKHSSHKFRGNKSGTSKLNEDDVVSVYDMLDEGKTIIETAKKFGVGYHTIHKIKMGINWGWLTGLGKEVT